MYIIQEGGYNLYVRRRTYKYCKRGLSVGSVDGREAVFNVRKKAYRWRRKMGPIFIVLKNDNKYHARTGACRDSMDGGRTVVSMQCSGLLNYLSIVL